MEHAWIVIRTKTFRERVAEAYLNGKSVTCYLPVKKGVARAGKPALAAAPIFPGYIFAKPEPAKIFDMRYVPGTCGIITFNGTPAVIPPREIENIRQIAASGLPLGVHGNLVPGQRVRVVVGPLAGLEGELFREKNQLRLVVNIFLLKQAVSVEIERSCVEPQ